MAELLSQSEWISFVRSRAADASRAAPLRAEQRAPVFGDVAIVLEDARRSRLRATLLNISDGGVMVKNESEIADGMPVQLELNSLGLNRDVAGEVRHCTQTLGGYKIGIRLTWKTE